MCSDFHISCRVRENLQEDNSCSRQLSFFIFFRIYLFTYFEPLWVKISHWGWVGSKEGKTFEKNETPQISEGWETEEKERKVRKKKSVWWLHKWIRQEIREISEKTKDLSISFLPLWKAQQCDFMSSKQTLNIILLNQKFGGKKKKKK